MVSSLARELPVTTVKYRAQKPKAKEDIPREGERERGLSTRYPQSPPGQALSTLSHELSL